MNANDKQAMLLDLREALEQWNDSAERWGYSPNGDFSESGQFLIEEYNNEGDIIGSGYKARIVIEPA